MRVLRRMSPRGSMFGGFGGTFAQSERLRIFEAKVLRALKCIKIFGLRLSARATRGGMVASIYVHAPGCTAGRFTGFGRLPCQ